MRELDEASAAFPSVLGSYCASQTLNGGGWRAPSENELETLWGDFYAPDSVGLDPGGAPDVGTLELESWYYVVGPANTNWSVDRTEAGGDTRDRARCGECGEPTAVRVVYGA